MAGARDLGEKEYKTRRVDRERAVRISGLQE